MLKRHEVEILLKAGHAKTEVARLSGVSLRSVKRIAEESPVEQVDDAKERVKRQIGRPSTVTNFRRSAGRIRPAIGGTACERPQQTAANSTKASRCRRTKPPCSKRRNLPNLPTS